MDPASVEYSRDDELDYEYHPLQQELHSMQALRDEYERQCSLLIGDLNDVRRRQAEHAGHSPKESH